MGKKVLQKEDRGEEKQVCNICITRHVNATLNCDHKFCYRCIIKWAKKKQTCPNCRREIRLITTNNRRVQFAPKPQSRSRVTQRLQAINNVPAPIIPPIFNTYWPMPPVPMFGYYQTHPVFYPYCFLHMMAVRNWALNLC